MPPTGSGGRGGGGCERIALTRGRLAGCALLPLPSLLCRQNVSERPITAVGGERADL